MYIIWPAQNVLLTIFSQFNTLHSLQVWMSMIVSVEFRIMLWWSLNILIGAHFAPEKNRKKKKNIILFDYMNIQENNGVFCTPLDLVTVYDIVGASLKYRQLMVLFLWFQFYIWWILHSFLEFAFDNCGLDLNFKMKWRYTCT